jgi:peroxiredoxin
MRALLASIFSRTFLSGVVAGIVLGCGGLYVFAQVYMSTVAGSASGGPELRKPAVSQDSLADHGAVPGNWRLQPIDGDDRHSFDTISERPVLLTIWASWCDPCTAELSSLQALADTTKQTARVMLVSTQSRDSVQTFLDEEGYSMPAYVTDDLPSVLEGELVPRTYLIRPNGTVVYRRVGGPVDWNVGAVHEVLTRAQSTGARESTNEAARAGLRIRD